MTAHVTDVYLTELSGDRAHAVTRSDWVLTASGQTLALDLYLQVDLRHEGGTWKVDTVERADRQAAARRHDDHDRPDHGGHRDDDRQQRDDGDDGTRHADHDALTGGLPLATARRRQG